MRFQGGTLFPAVVAAVLVIGLALIVYARASQPALDASPPQLGDHWHAAYGFQLCADEPEYVFTGDLEILDDEGYLIGSQEYITSGVHSHDDGVIHWHPNATRAYGKRADLGVFFGNYGLDISDNKLSFAEGTLMNHDTKAIVSGDDIPLTYEEGETQCDGEDAELKVVVWEDFSDPGSSRQYTANFNDIPFDGDGKVVVVAFVPNDVDVEMPSWAADLPALGAADQAPGEASGGSIAPPLETEPIGTEPDGTEAESVDTEPAATEPLGREPIGSEPFGSEPFGSEPMSSSPRDD